ncbi:DNA-binding transcriptional LysR family regulator [Propionibacteriaceae bacterium ES.041]|uniref:LysR family transcriptional regulator n=1 Tax=Enemella evansiae TaxID=2016499 RepID=UPI000B96F9C3|nr:LysR family transcriptional regulator [Enemella evansiae]OYN96378.1 LysR family transcriptional regulator [Enemella evansiae]PFG65627.1 DNA-binding transcriptional LysR family regulator [Propionibacteriaceae bacterium ES.041]
MDLNRLRVFRAVVSSGSIRGAADTLDYSPASVSQQVAQLQRETGLRLIEKVGRGIEPTPAGTLLARRLDTLFAELADLDGFITGLRTGRGTTFRLSYFSSLGSAWMPRILATLTHEFPDVRVDLHVRDQYEPRARPRPDLQLIAHAGQLNAPDGYHAVPVTIDPYVVAVPAGHPLAADETPLPLGILQDEKWIDTNAGQGSCRQITIDACAAAGFRPDLHIQAQDYTTALALVAAENGISVLPAIGARQSAPGVHIRPLAEPTPRRQITALIDRDWHHHPVGRRALQLIGEASRNSTC